MNQTPEKAHVFKVDSKNVELIEKNKSNSTSSIGSAGKDIAFAVLSEVSKTVSPAIADGVMKAFEDERADRKAFRQDMRSELKEEHKHYMELIKKEEAKEDYDQERLVRLYERLDKIRQERKEIDEKSLGFTKGLVKFVTRLMSSKSETK